MSAPAPWVVGVEDVYRRVAEGTYLSVADEEIRRFAQNLLDDAIDDAIALGLRAMGYENIRGSEDKCASWSWPAWAQAVYQVLEVDDQAGVDLMRAVSEWPEEDRAALEAAEALGGGDAVAQVLNARLTQEPTPWGSGA